MDPEYRHNEIALMCWAPAPAYMQISTCAYLISMCDSGVTKGGATRALAPLILIQVGPGLSNKSCSQTHLAWEPGKYARCMNIFWSMSEYL